MILMKKKILFIFCMISYLSFAFRASTNSFNERIDNYEGYKEIIIYNDSLSPKIYGFKILPSKVKTDKMYQWTHLSDTTITIPPLDNYVLKIYSKSPPNVPKGQYNCYLQITPVIVPNPTNSNTLVIPLVINFELDGYVGKLDYNKNFIINNFNLDGNRRIICQIKNNCFANIETSIKLLNKYGIVLYDHYIGVIRKKEFFKLNFKIPNYVNMKDIASIEFYNFNNADTIKKIYI